MGGEIACKVSSEGDGEAVVVCVPGRVQFDLSDQLLNFDNLPEHTYRYSDTS